MSPSETRRGPGEQSPGPSSFWTIPADTPERDRIAAFIKANLPLAPVASLPGVVLHTAAPASGLRGLLDEAQTDHPPYWAYPWAGGLALARHTVEHPQTVAGRRVLDLGAGSGLVAIAAARAGAAEVFAADVDPHATVATILNAAANGVAVTPVEGDLTGGPPPPVDVVLAGDLFYAPDLAEPVAAFLLRCVRAGAEVLVGDPGRVWLPRTHLRRLTEHPVRDVADRSDGEPGTSWVYAFADPARA